MIAADAAARTNGVWAGRLRTLGTMGVTMLLIGALSWLAAGAGANAGLAGTGSTSGTGGPVVGNLAPDFNARTWDGHAVSLSEFAGRPVWLTFGATWCPDCRVEAPDVEATYRAHRGDGLVVLGVFVQESGEDVGSYAQRAGLAFPIAVDQSGAIEDQYGVLGLPTQYFIGRDGRIAQVRIGPLTRDDMESAITLLID
jgi:cytochrome c biogenesis protein CcmG, thiol:disulfide interchange protein DsbE